MWTLKCDKCGIERKEGLAGVFQIEILTFKRVMSGTEFHLCGICAQKLKTIVDNFLKK